MTQMPEDMRRKIRQEYMRRCLEFQRHHQNVGQKFLKPYVLNREWEIGHVIFGVMDWAYNELWKLSPKDYHQGGKQKIENDD